MSKVGIGATLLAAGILFGCTAATPVEAPAPLPVEQSALVPVEGSCTIGLEDSSRHDMADATATAKGFDASTGTIRTIDDEEVTEGRTITATLETCDLGVTYEIVSGTATIAVRELTSLRPALPCGHRLRRLRCRPIPSPSLQTVGITFVPDRDRRIRVNSELHRRLLRRHEGRPKPRRLFIAMFSMPMMALLIPKTLVAGQASP